MYVAAGIFQAVWCLGHGFDQEIVVRLLTGVRGCSLLRNISADSLTHTSSYFMDYGRLSQGVKGEPR
jgi:hypothetical protein